MKFMKYIICFSVFLFLIGCQTPKDEEPDLDEMVLSEDEEILEGTLAGEVYDTPQETLITEQLESNLKVE